MEHANFELWICCTLARPRLRPARRPATRSGLASVQWRRRSARVALHRRQQRVDRQPERLHKGEQQRLLKKFTAEILMYIPATLAQQVAVRLVVARALQHRVERDLR